MLELAVATEAETFERMREPLSDRGIRARSIAVDERTLPLLESPAEFSGFDVGFVYPSRLMEGAVVDAHLQVPWVNDRSAVLTSRNKSEVITRLAAAGLPVPDSIMVSNPTSQAARIDAYETIDPPVVIKPNSTTRGVGVARADDLDSYLGITDYLGLVHDFLATRDRSFLVQEFLPDARDYRVMVIDGACVGGVERRLPKPVRQAGRWKHNVHRSAEAVGIDVPTELRELAERAAEVLAIDYLGVDFLVTDDRTVITETNARPTIDDVSKYDPAFYDRLADLITRTANEAS